MMRIFLGKMASMAVALLLLASCGGTTSEPAVANAGKASIPTVTTTASGDGDMPVLPVTGWYWNPAEGGRGFAIERQGNQLYMAAFLYETTGAPTWYVSTMTLTAPGQYSGELSRYTGGQTLLGAFRQPNSAKVADAVLNFSSSTTGVLQVKMVSGGGATIQIERFPISTPAFAPSTVPFANGWYWNQAEGGRGYFIEVQGTQAFIGSFMYDADGQPVWYVSYANVEGLAGVGGLLERYSGGQSLTGPFRPATKSPVSPGPMSFDLSNDGIGRMSLPNKASVDMMPYGFNGGRSTPPEGKCAAGEVFSNGNCLRVDRLWIVPVIYLNIELVGQRGVRYQLQMCHGGNYSCVPLNEPYFVSYEDLRAEGSQLVMAYVGKVRKFLQSMLGQMNRAHHMPSTQQLQQIFGRAIAAAIENESQTVEQDVVQALNAFGYAVTLEDDSSHGDPNEPCAPAAKPLGTGPVRIQDDAPEACQRNRKTTLGWTVDASITASDACGAAQDPKRNTDIITFNAQNISACYCAPNVKVNDTTRNYVCRVYFDAGF